MQRSYHMYAQIGGTYVHCTICAYIPFGECGNRAHPFSQLILCS